MPTGIYKRTTGNIKKLKEADNSGWFQKGHPVPNKWIINLKVKLTVKQATYKNPIQRGINISKAKKGIKHPNQSGEKSRFWRGGVTGLYKTIRNLLEYNQWRSDVFQRDNWTCQTCGARSGNGKAVYLEAHHLKEFNKIIEEYKIKTFEEALICEKLWDINNGRTLCKKCHDKTKKGRYLVNQKKLS